MTGVPNAGDEDGIGSDCAGAGRDRKGGAVRFIFQCSEIFTEMARTKLSILDALGEQNTNEESNVELPSRASRVPTRHLRDCDWGPCFQKVRYNLCSASSTRSYGSITHSTRRLI